MSSKINKKVLALCLTVVAITAVLQGCAKQQNNQEVEISTSSHYYSNDYEITKKDDEQVATCILYEYIKDDVLAETSLNGRIGDVVDLPVKEEYAADSISAMNGEYDSSIKAFKDGKAVIRGMAYIDADDGKLKTIWNKGIGEEDLNLSYNADGYENIAYALSEEGSDVVKAWTAHPNGLLLVQPQSWITTESTAPSDEFRLIDSYAVTGNYNDDLGLSPAGELYTIRKN